MKVNYLIKIYLILLVLLIVIRHIYQSIYNNFSPLKASDQIFLNNSWSSYQYAEFKVLIHQNSYIQIRSSLIRKIRNWSLNQRWYLRDQIDGIIKKSRISLNEYIQKLIYKKVPCISQKMIPFYIIFFDSEKVYSVFLSHYYCDGQIFMDFLNLVTNQKQVINWKPYNYIPVLSDIKLLNFLIKSYFFINNYKPKLILDVDHSYLITKNIILSNQKYNRYQIFAIIFDFFFKYVKCQKIKVAFTMGINDDPSYHNRIGLITRNILRKKNLIEYEKMLRKKLNKKKNQEGVISYDLVRNFPVNLMRSKLNMHLDIIFTAFRFNNSGNNFADCEYQISSFIGFGKIPVYINAITMKQKLIISLKISTSQFDYQKCLEQEENCILHHSFSKDFNIYQHKYQQLRLKYKKLKNQFDNELKNKHIK